MERAKYLRSVYRIMRDMKLYIDGEFHEPATGEWYGSVDPYTGEVWTEIPMASTDQLDQAVEAAHEAAFHGEWAEFTPTERGEYLFALADELEKHAREHAEMEVRDNGKPLREFLGQHRAMPDWYRFYGGLADKVHGDTIPSSKRDKYIYTMREPVGVVGAIAPWNSPLMLSTWKLAPALAAGNAVVLKPARNTSTSALSFATVVDEVGFPDGVVNVVSGAGSVIGEALTAHEKVDKISLTGGTETGSRVAQRAGEALKSTTMELGGKSPNVIFSDARFDAAVNGALAGIFSAAGQSCSAGSRLLVHSPIYDEVVDALVEGAESIRLGDPKDPETEMGPLASEDQFEKVSDYVDIGLEGGATLACGGEPAENLGSDLFFQPTIFTDVDNKSRLAQEEVFGPVLAVIEFETEDEAIEIANDVKFGLAAGVWTEDMRRAHRVASAIRAGRVWINTYRNSDFTAPQGGYKMSGWGHENGVDAIEEFLETKSVWIELDEDPDTSFSNV